MKSGIFDRRLLTILLIVFVQMLGASLILPILPLYAQREFQMSAEMIALLTSAFFAAQFLAGPYIGRLSDNFGRVPVLIGSQVGTVISFILLAFAPSLGWLFFARILDGITGGNIIVAQAYITDITPREKRTESLGYIFAVFGLGFIFGPALGGVLAAAFGPTVPFLVAAAAAAAVVILTWYALDETLSAEERRNARARRAGSLTVGSALRNAPLMTVLLVAFFGQFALGLLQATFALFGEAVLFQGKSREVTDIGIGLLLTVVGASQLFTQTYLLRRLARRFSEGQLVVIGSLLRMIGMVIYAVVTTPWLGAFGSLFFATGFGLASPPLQSMSTSLVDEQDRGGVLGMFQSSINLSTIISTAIAGVLFAQGPRIPYWVGAAMSLAVVVAVMALMPGSVFGATPPRPGLPQKNEERDRKPGAA